MSEVPIQVKNLCRPFDIAQVIPTAAQHRNTRKQSAVPFPGIGIPRKRLPGLCWLEAYFSHLRRRCRDTAVHRTPIVVLN